MKNIFVLVKEVADPEGVYALDSDGNILSGDLPRLLSMFDENALEAAITLQEEEGAKVTAICYGRPGSDKSLMHALAMGADVAVLIEDTEAESRGSQAVASVLTAAIRQIGGADLIIAGRESSDIGNGLVGPLVAQLLGQSFLTLIVKIEVVDGSIRLTRLAEQGYDVFDVTAPVLITVSNQLNTPRYPSVLKFLQAKKKPMQRWAVSDLGVDLTPPADSRVHVLRRYQPVQLGNCRLAQGGTLEAQVDDLISALREERLI